MCDKCTAPHCCCFKTWDKTISRKNFQTKTAFGLISPVFARAFTLKAERVKLLDIVRCTTFSNGICFFLISRDILNWQNN